MNKSTKTVSVIALFTAFIMVSTAFLKLPITLLGYIHAGDIFIFASCYFLRPKYAALSAGIGSMLADLIVGYVNYMPATLIIKALMAFAAGLIMYKDPNIIRLFLGFLAGGIIMLLGYFVFEGFIYGWALAFTNLPLAAVQPAAGIAGGILLILAAKKIPFLVSFRQN